MLGRTANGIFWMFRYLERAENTARLLDAGFRLALTRDPAAVRSEWRSVLVTLGLAAGFERTGEELTGPAVTNYVLRDRDNPGNVLRMIEDARSNARMVRTALTREVWEATNESWFVLREMLARPVRPTTLGETLAAIRRQTTLVRGAMEGTMLRNEIFNFARLGTYLERADSTSRILDVKYYVLLPSVHLVGSTLDNSQWETVLRSLAGERAYRWLNPGALDSRGIADFIIRDSRFPRSLSYCFDKLNGNMTRLARDHGRESPTQAILLDTTGRLKSATTERIFEYGLHEFLIDVLAFVRQFADELSREFRFTS
jgi:uncharacterized alpha-E superfamily protein